MNTDRIFLKAGLFSIMLTLASQAAFASIFDDELSADEQPAVQNGKAIVHTEDSDGSAWPIITVYQKSDATPEEVAAVMADYDLHKVMFRDKDGTGIVESTPHCNPSNLASCEIDYKMTFPSVLGISLSPETYTSQNILSSSNEVPYQVDWHRLRSSSLIKDLVGQFRVEPMPAGTGALVIYMQFINPNSPLAGMLKKKAITTVKQSAQQLIDQTMRERAGDRATLNRQIAALHQALGK